MHRLIATLGLVLASMVGSVRGDAYVVTLDPEVVGASGDGASGGGAGRLILFFITETSPRWSKTQPMEAPFFGKMQPVASVAVKELKPGESVTVDGSALAFPESLDNLNGPIRVQAVLDVDETERSHEQGPAAAQAAKAGHGRADAPAGRSRPAGGRGRPAGQPGPGGRLKKAGEACISRPSLQGRLSSAGRASHS
jgi:hypothetical protein